MDIFKLLLCLTIHSYLSINFNEMISDIQDPYVVEILFAEYHHFNMNRSRVIGKNIPLETSHMFAAILEFETALLSGQWLSHANYNIVNVYDFKSLITRQGFPLGYGYFVDINSKEIAILYRMIVAVRAIVRYLCMVKHSKIAMFGRHFHHEELILL